MAQFTFTPTPAKTHKPAQPLTAYRVVLLLILANGLFILLFGGVQWFVERAQDNRAWRTATTANTAAAYFAYREACPKGRHLVEARRRYDERWWEDIGKKADSDVHFAVYLRTYPHGQHVERARQAYEAWSWKHCSAEGYLSRFPQGRHAHEARRRMEAMYWDEARSNDTPRAYLAYLQQCSTGVHADAARTRIRQLRQDDAPYEEARRFGVPQMLSLFLREYPGHRRWQEAAAELERLKKTCDSAEALSWPDAP